jgi:hypothetical protein
MLTTANTVCQCVHQHNKRLRSGPESREREAEKNCEEDHLKYVPLREGVKYRGGNDVHQEFSHSLGLGLPSVLSDRLRVECGHIDIETASRAYDVAYDQTYEKREGGNNFEIQQCHTAEATDFLKVFHAGNPGDHRAENDKSDDHGDDADKSVSQRLHGNCALRIQVPQDDGRNHSKQHLRPKGAVERELGGVQFCGNGAVRLLFLNGCHRDVACCAPIGPDRSL